MVEARGTAPRSCMPSALQMYVCSCKVPDSHLYVNPSNDAVVTKSRSPGLTK